MSRKRGPHITLDEARALFHYDPGTGKLTRKVAVASNAPVGSQPGWSNGNGYRRVTVRENRYFEHRLVWFMHYGEWPTDEIDHIDNDRTNNSIANLRLAARVNNCQNTSLRSDNTSGVKGVYFDKRRGRWVSRIHAEGKVIQLGNFYDLDEAAAAYEEAAARYYGAFANPATSI